MNITTMKNGSTVVKIFKHLVFSLLIICMTAPWPSEIKAAISPGEETKSQTVTTENTGKTEKKQPAEKKKDKNKKEKKVEKKETEIKEGTVFTDEDIKRMKESRESFSITEIPAEEPKPNPQSETDATIDKDKKEKPKTTTPTIDPKTTEAYWKQRKADIFKSIQDNEKKISQLEERLFKLNLKLNGTDMLMEEHLKLKERINRIYNEIQNYKRGLETLRQSMEDLEDEARKAGVPPGWLRD